MLVQTHSYFHIVHVQIVKALCNGYLATYVLNPNFTERRFCCTSNFCQNAIIVTGMATAQQKPLDYSRSVSENS